MTPTFRHWLPKGAFTDDAVRAVLSATIALWSERWFARREATIGAVRFASAPITPAAQSLRVMGKIVDAELPGRGKRLLLEALLDIDLAGQTPIEGDHHVLDTLAARAMEDLLATLEETFGAECARDHGARIVATLAMAGSEMLTVSFPDSAVVPPIKARMGSRQPAGGTPRGRMSALGPMHVVADGILGQADLALDDLGGLAIGDVLILDRALQEPVELRLSDTGARIGRGRLGRNDGKISIQL